MMVYDWGDPNSSPCLEAILAILDFSDSGRAKGQIPTLQNPSLYQSCFTLVKKIPTHVLGQMCSNLPSMSLPQLLCIMPATTPLPTGSSTLLGSLALPEASVPRCIMLKKHIEASCYSTQEGLDEQDQMLKQVP